jgi:F-type H+-transporting ATPase subunit epsilon
MLLTILTPEKEIFNGTVSSIKVPGITGQFEILDNHAAIVSALGSGKVRLVTDSKTTVQYEISKGFIEVLNNKVALLVQGLKEA